MSEILSVAVKNILSLFDEHVFEFGPDDQAKVERCLSELRAGLEPDKTLSHYVVIGYNGWVKRETLWEALTAHIVEYGQGSFYGYREKDAVIHVRRTSADAFMDDFGTLYAHAMEKTPDITVPVKVHKAIVDAKDDLDEVIWAHEESTDVE